MRLLRSAPQPDTQTSNVVSNTTAFDRMLDTLQPQSTYHLKCLVKIQRGWRSIQVTRLYHVMFTKFVSWVWSFKFKIFSSVLTCRDMRLSIHHDIDSLHEMTYGGCLHEKTLPTWYDIVCTTQHHLVRIALRQWSAKDLLGRHGLHEQHKNQP